ncbi:MAG: hypothetical protein AAFR22_16355 [Chloroflexota bacterium]
MTEFVAFHPDNETLGIAIMATVKATQYRGIEEFLKKHNLENIKPDAWYPQQAELNLLKDINNMMDFVAIGMKIPDMVEYGVEVKTIADALTLLDAGYQHNHLEKDPGGFAYQWTGERSLRLTAVKNPYPKDLVYGILYRLVQKYRPADSGVFAVLRDVDASDKDTYSFSISW